MKLFDRTCAGALFLLALVECWLVPRDYTGRIWIFGTGLALLFASIFNFLRIRNASVRDLRLASITANILMTVFALVLMWSIGRERTLANPQVLLISVLLALETIFSMGRKP